MILGHPEKMITVQYGQHKMCLRRTTARRRLICEMTWQRISPRMAAAAIAADRSRRMEGESDADHLERLVEVQSKMELYTAEDVVEMLGDLADHLVTINGAPAAEMLGEPEVTVDAIDRACTHPAVVGVIWQMWHRGGAPTEVEREKSDG